EIYGCLRLRRINHVEVEEKKLPVLRQSDAIWGHPQRGATNHFKATLWCRLWREVDLRMLSHDCVEAVDDSFSLRPQVVIEVRNSLIRLSDAFAREHILTRILQATGVEQREG